MLRRIIARSVLGMPAPMHHIRYRIRPRTQVTTTSATITTAKIASSQFFQASSGDELKKIYENLGTEFALERRDTEVSALFAAAALFRLVLAGTLSTLWFHRPLAPGSVPG